MDPAAAGFASLKAEGDTSPARASRRYISRTPEKKFQKKKSLGNVRILQLVTEKVPTMSRLRPDFEKGTEDGGMCT